VPDLPERNYCVIRGVCTSNSHLILFTCTSVLVHHLHRFHYHHHHIIIRDELGLNRPVSALPNSLF